MNAGSFNTSALLAALSAKASEADDDTDTEELDDDDSESLDSESVFDLLNPLSFLSGQSRRMSPRNYASGLGGQANGTVHTPQGNLTVQFRDVVRKRDMEIALNRVREDVKRLSGQITEVDKRHTHSATVTSQKIKALEREQTKLRKANASLNKRLQNQLLMVMLLRDTSTLKYVEGTDKNGVLSSMKITKAEYDESTNSNKAMLMPLLFSENIDPVMALLLSK